MTFIVKTDGINDSLETASQIDLTGDFEIILYDFRYASILGTGDFGVICGLKNTSTNFITTRETTSVWQIRINNVSTDITFAELPVTTDRTLFKFKRVGTTGTLTYNGNVINKTVDSGTFSFDAFAKTNTNLYFDIEFSKAEVYDNGVLVHQWIADNSTHTGAVLLTDEVGTNDLTGVKTATDGSNWEELVSTIDCDMPDYYTLNCNESATRSLLISGMYTGSPTTISYKVNGGSAVEGDANPDSGAYMFVIPDLSVGHYDIEIYFTNDATTTVTVSKVTIAPIFVGAGQSNILAHSTNNQTFVPNGSIIATMLGNDYVFKQLVDPIGSNVNQVDLVQKDDAYGGSWLIHFANDWVAERGYPLGIIPSAKGSTGIDLWQKDSTSRIDGLNLYESMEKRINACGGCEYVFFQAGEYNIKFNLLTTAEFEALLNKFVDDVWNDFGCKTIIVPLHTITDGYDQGNGTTTGQAAVRQAQINVAASNPRALISTALTDIDISIGGTDDDGDNDGVHFRTDLAISTVGHRVYDFYDTLNSTLNLSVSGLPDGTYSTYINDSDGFQVFSGNVTFISGAASIALPVPVSSRVYGYIGDVINGCGITGVTE